MKSLNGLENSIVYTTGNSTKDWKKKLK